MKLYFAPGACSLSPHIVLHEAGFTADYQEVDTKTKVMKGGGDFFSVSPKGAVPTLRLDDGEILTEGPAIVQYIADLKPDTKLAPAAGGMERYRLQEWLNYIATELHKTFAPLFDPASTEEMRQRQRNMLIRQFGFLNTDLDGKAYVMGETFTVADAYLFTILNWTFPTGIDLAQWPVVQAYRQRIAQRPAVLAAMKEEGLIQ